MAFKWFRKHQVLMLVVFGLAAMLAFVVLPPVLDYLAQSQNPDGSDEDPREVVVTWKYGDLTRADLNGMAARRSYALAFLAGFGQRLGADEQTVFNALGIPPDNGDETLMSRMLLAKQAEEMGIVVTDDAIFLMLDTLSGDLLKRSDYGQILENVAGTSVSQGQLFESLRLEFAASEAQRLLGSGRGLTTPLEAFDYYNRVNREVNAEVMAVAVADFVDQVGEPTREQIREMYDEYKASPPYPNSPEPGFYQPTKKRFQAFQASRVEFLDAIKGEVTDEEVFQYYHSHRYEFVRPEVEMQEPGAIGETTPAEDTTAEGETTSEGETGDTPPTESAEGDTTPVEPTTEGETAPAASDAPPTPPETDTTPAAEDTPATETPEVEAPATETPAAETPTTDTPEVETPTTETPAEEAPVQESRSGLRRSEVYSLTAFQGEGEAEGETPAAEEPAADAGEVTTEGAAPTEGVETAPESTDPVEPATEGTTEPAADTDEPATSPAETTEGETPVEGEGGTESETPAEGETPTEGETATEGETPAGEPEIEVVEEIVVSTVVDPIDYMTLEEVADDIRTILAEPLALKAMQDALNAIEEDMRAYRSELYRYESDHDDEIKPEDLPPKDLPPPDLTSTAKQLNLHVVDTNTLIDQAELYALTTLGQSYMGLQYQPGSSTQSFPDMAFSRDMLPFTAVRTYAIGDASLYVVWETQVVPGKVLPLSEVRDQVVDAWKLQEAFKLAKAEAESLAEQARQGERSLAETFPGDKYAVTDTGMFRWYTWYGFGQPVATREVSGVEQPGREFMEGVFGLRRNGVGIAPNDPHSIVYVVRIANDSPPEPDRRDMFFRLGPQAAVGSVAAEANQHYMRGLYQEVLDQYDVEWQLPPRRADRN